MEQVEMATSQILPAQMMVLVTRCLTTWIYLKNLKQLKTIFHFNQRILKNNSQRGEINGQ